MRTVIVKNEKYNFIGRYKETPAGIIGQFIANGKQYDVYYKGRELYDLVSEDIAGGCVMVKATLS